MVRAASVLTLIAACLTGSPAGAHLRAGDVVPHYRIRTLDGREIDSDALRGQVVVINRWAIWCAPCKIELPALDAYYRAHAGEGLRVFAVMVDGAASAETLKTLSATYAFPLARAVHGGLPELLGVPTNYVIDRDGIVRYAETDTFDAAKLDAVVGPLLTTPPPATGSR